MMKNGVYAYSETAYPSMSPTFSAVQKLSSNDGVVEWSVMRLLRIAGWVATVLTCLEQKKTVGIDRDCR